MNTVSDLITIYPALQVMQQWWPSRPALDNFCRLRTQYVTALLEDIVEIINAEMEEKPDLAKTGISNRLVQVQNEIRSGQIFIDNFFSEVAGTDVACDSKDFWVSTWTAILIQAVSFKTPTTLKKSEAEWARTYNTFHIQLSRHRKEDLKNIMQTELTSLCGDDGEAQQLPEFKIKFKNDAASADSKPEMVEALAAFKVSRQRNEEEVKLQEWRQKAENFFEGLVGEANQGPEDPVEIDQAVELPTLQALASKDEETQAAWKALCCVGAVTHWLAAKLFQNAVY